MEMKAMKSGDEGRRQRSAASEIIVKNRVGVGPWQVCEQRWGAWRASSASGKTSFHHAKHNVLKQSN